MSETNIHRGWVEDVKTMFKLAALGAMGLCFFCEPKLILRHLSPENASLFQQLYEQTNEKDEALQLIEAVPDDAAPVVAHMLNYAMSRPEKRVRKGRGDKPHLTMLDTLREIVRAIERIS